jgi:hypothetical protein
MPIIELAKIMCAVDEIGKNSVSPSIRAKIIVSRKDM